MKRKEPSPPADADQEISALIETLHRTGQRLEELTAGEVDAVADREGRTFLLRRAQEQLRHSEAAKQAAILNALPAHIALLDTQGRIISVNEAWRRFASENGLRSPDDGIDLNYLEICARAHGDDAPEAPKVEKGIHSVLAGEAPSFSIEYPCHSPAEPRWFLMTVTPLADDRRNGAVVMHLNITERKRGEEEMRRFASAMDTIADAVFLIDRSTMRFVHINEAACRFQNQAREEMLALEPWVLFGSSRAELEQAYDTLIASGVDAEPVEMPLRRGDGSQVWVELRRHAQRSGDNYTIVSLVRDITERKQAEDALRESKNLLRLVVENVPSRIFWKDRDLRYLGCNTLFAKDAGHAKPDELTGKTDFEMGWKDQAELYRGDDRAVLESGVPKPDIEEPQTTPDGSTIWLRTSKAPLRDKDNHIVGILGLYQDITKRKQVERELIESEARFRGFVEQSIAGCYIIQDGKLAYVNRRFAEIFGYDSADEIIGMGALSMVHEKDHALVANELLQRIEGEVASNSVEFTGLRKNGTMIDIAVHGTRATHDGRPASIGLLQDISERKTAEIRIKRLNRVYAVLSGINTLIVRTRDRQELFDEACRITVEQGKFQLAWIGLLDANGLDVTPMARAGIDKGYLDKIQLTARDGTPDRCEMLTRALREQAVVICNDIDTDPQMARWREEALLRGYRSVVVLPLQFADKVLGFLLLYASEKDFFDIEEMKLLTELAGDIAYAIDHIDKQERLDYFAYYDALTGLANRTLFLDRVAQYVHSAAAGGHKLAVALIDLERFKIINDSLGRPAGDALLRQVAEWLKQSTGDASLLARVDADHFAVLQPDIQLIDDLAQFLEQGMEAFLQHPFRLDGAVFRVAFRAGVALFPDDGADADTLFRNAEAALKKAKASGERYLFYTQQMTEAVAGKLTLENQLRQALDNEEFVLHYQPKVNLASGKLTGAEALIRWNDPRTGLVPPGRFIPILEEIGMIYDVGRWALKKAIEDYLRWRAAGLPAVRIAVNVSALQLRNRGFIEDIRQAISIDAQAPAGLELEITENLIMEDVKGTIASLQAIHDLGVSIAIDDFGTGFSSLSYLAKLPVDALKIDRSFVLDMTAAPEGLALVSTIISLAHSLKLTVVAEGVETEGQSRLLACDEMQGFLFSKPVPAAIFEANFLAPGSGT